ncbi:MAG TPA: hypothetical protein V6C88_08290, partial [Chroococcidiopsis sp.]
MRFKHLRFKHFGRSAALSVPWLKDWSHPGQGHTLILVAIVGFGALLRFWQLDLKPLWLDEVITAIFALGKSYSDIPLDVIVSADALDQLFTYRPGASCGAIAQRVA